MYSTTPTNTNPWAQIQRESFHYELQNLESTVSYYWG